MERKKRAMGYRDKHTVKQRQRAAALHDGASWRFLMKSWGDCLCRYVCVCVCVFVWRAWCWHRGCLQEAAVPCHWQTLSVHFLCAARQSGTRVDTRMHTHSHRVEAGQDARLESDPTNWESEGGMEGRKEGGRKEGVQQRAALSHSLGIWHMALTHSSALWPAEHQHSGRGGTGRDRGRKAPPFLLLASSLVLWKTGNVFTCVLCVCVFLTCGCLMHQCLTLS